MSPRSLRTTVTVSAGFGPAAAAAVRAAPRHWKKFSAKSIIQFTKVDDEQPNIHIAIAPTKNNDRLEWFIEKTTEIGINEITPIICEHSERKVIKTDRFQKILESAMKQSLHYYLPYLIVKIAFYDFIKIVFDGQKFMAHCEVTYK